MKGVFCFKVKGDGGNQGTWIVDVKNGDGAVKFNANGDFRFIFFSILNAFGLY